ncbi:DUF3080 family protein [Oceanospirillum beijerinckii]|uniref:DUF3080 family protein n=1 Tax=Oceanospirillum beijerinckii TaxID=64976 RepID=UPI0003F6D0B8|nr:DUF3080 family protein [Oceanospirillum beijerinckii]
MYKISYLHQAVNLLSINHITTKRYQPLKALSILAVGFMVLVITACSEQDSLQYRFDNYQNRLASTLDSDQPAVAPLTNIHYPDKRQRLREIPKYSEGMIEVWDFRRCDLMQLINQRNSNLGKVMAHSQRFIYENAFWQKLKPCYEEREQWLVEDAEFVHRIEQLYQYKQNIMPAVFHQMLFAGPELDSQFGATQQAIPPEQVLEYNTLVSALDQLITISKDPLNSPINGTGLEQTLQTLYQQPLMLSLLKTLQISTVELNQTARLLEDKRDKRPLCLSGTATPKAKILFNLLQKFYLQGIQPELASHNRMANQLLPRMDQLFQLAEKGSELEKFRLQWLSNDYPQGLWQRYQQANKRHTHIWNQVLRECGLFPRS